MALTFNLPSQIVVQTAAQWAVDATVYSNKRILVTSDVYYGSTDQRKFKIADGTQTWSQLDYTPIAQTLAEVLANGNTTGGAIIESDNGYSDVKLNNSEATLSHSNGVDFGRVVNNTTKTAIEHTALIELNATDVKLMSNSLSSDKASPTDYTNLQLADGQASLIFTNSNISTGITTNQTKCDIAYYNGGSGTYAFFRATDANSSIEHPTLLEINSPTINLGSATPSTIVEVNGSNNLTYAAKATGYNLALGTTAGTVTEGNDSRLTNSRIQTIYTDITPFTSATTGADELAQSKLIAGGTLTTGDFFDVYNWVSKTGTAGNKTTKVWINTSATLAGATQIAQFENTTAAGSQLFFRTFAIKSNTSIRSITTGTALAAGFISVGTLGVDIAIPTLASDVYIMISVSRTNGADTHISEALKIVPQKAV
jgi:hypothetical protein